MLDSPQHGFVMEVRAAEIVPSEEYDFGHTLRFPRAVKAFREDKAVADATTDQALGALGALAVEARRESRGPCCASCRLPRATKWPSCLWSR